MGESKKMKLEAIVASLSTSKCKEIMAMLEEAVSAYLAFCGSISILPMGHSVWNLRRATRQKGNFSGYPLLLSMT